MNNSNINPSEMVVLVLACCVSAEVIWRFKIQSRANTFLKRLKIILKNITSEAISDHWKQKVIISYAFEILRYGLLVPALILTAILPILWSTLLLDDRHSNLEILSNTFVLIALTFFSILYLVFRNWLHVRIQQD